MVENQHWSYDLLKSAIGGKQISIRDLDYYKELFKDDIQSTRRYACIKTLGDLLDCLERRDRLSEYDIGPLQTVAENFADDEIDMALEKYVQPESSELQNVYKLQRMQESIRVKSEFKSEPPKVEQKSIVVIEFTSKKRDDIYKLIAREIGRDWRFFGRELLVRSGELDEIAEKHPHDLRSKVYEIFQIFESDSRHNPREHYNIICEALDSCKRKDIRRHVQKIMSY